MKECVSCHSPLIKGSNVAPSSFGKICKDCAAKGVTPKSIQSIQPIQSDSRLSQPLSQSIDSASNQTSNNTIQSSTMMSIPIVRLPRWNRDIRPKIRSHALSDKEKDWIIDMLDTWIENIDDVWDEVIFNIDANGVTQ